VSPVSLRAAMMRRVNAAYSSVKTDRNCSPPLWVYNLGARYLIPNSDNTKTGYSTDAQPAAALHSEKAAIFSEG
jgi:hypothetical protein